MSYFFALLPPFLDSLGNYLDKIILSKYNINVISLTVYSGLFAFFSGLIISLFTGFVAPDIKTTILLISAGCIGLLILFAYFKALTLDEASRVGSLFQLAPVMVLTLSYVFLHESLSTKQYIGSAFIIVSGFSLSLQKIKSGVLRINKAFFYMLIACFFTAIVYLLFKLGIRELGFWQTLPYEGLGNGITAVGILAFGNNFSLVKKTIRKISTKVFIYVLVIEILYRVSRYSLFFSLTFLKAPLVSVLQGIQPFLLLVFGIVLSLWFPYILKEVVTKQTVRIKLVSVIGIFIGLYLIFL